MRSGRGVSQGFSEAGGRGLAAGMAVGLGPGFGLWVSSDTVSGRGLLKYKQSLKA